MEERRQIEERYFDDETFFQEMLIIEEELIDSYVNGDLSDEEVERFEKHYLTTPERRAQVEFAKALAVSLPRVRSIQASDESRPSWLLALSSQFTALRERYRPLRWGIITGLVVAVGGSLLLVGANRWLRNQADRLEQESALLAQQRQEAARLNEQLERDLRRLEQERKRIESLPVGGSPDVKISIGTLFPALTRSGQAGQVLHISPEAALVLLQAPVEPDAGKSYQAVLIRDGTEILRLNHLTSRSASGGSIVEIPITVAMLNGRSYSLTIKPEDGEEGTDIYPFEIQKP